VRRRRFSGGAIEPLGLVVSRAAALRAPRSIETSPVATWDWETAVGSRIAARTRPVRLDRGVLVVRTATAPWAQELALLADTILTQLRARGVTVESLRFLVGPVDAPERPATRSEMRTSPPAVPLPPSVEAVVERIADPELRDAIAQAAAKNLGWQSTMGALPPNHRGGPSTMEEPLTSAPSDARAPRSAAPESARPARTRPIPGARRGKP
jgi:hypothetical protein